MLFFSEFLNEPKVIVYLSSLFCKMLHYIARFQRDSFLAFQSPVFDPASRQCAQVLVDYSVLELFFLAKVVLRFGRICTRHSRPRFPEKIPSALKGKFSSSTSY